MTEKKNPDAGLDPMADPRASAAYRRDVALHLGDETLLKALRRAREA